MLPLLLATAVLTTATPSPHTPDTLLFSLEFEGAPVDSFLPLDPGTTWVYGHVRHESPHGDTITGTWVEEVTVTGVRPIPTGRLVTLESTVRDLTVTSTAPRHLAEDRAWFEEWVETATHHDYIIRDGYVYPWYRSADEAAALEPERIRQWLPKMFLPMREGLRWREREHEEEALAQELAARRGDAGHPDAFMYYWVVEGREPIQIGPGETVNAFHLVYRALSGLVHVWFAPGIGVVRESSVHSGTYWESESTLLEFRHPE